MEKSFKQFLLLNRWTDFEIISHECSLVNPVPKVLKPVHSVEKKWPPELKIENSLKDFSALTSGWILK